MQVKILYDYYLDGYNNGVTFGYIPDFNGIKTIQAYTKGFHDAKNKKDKLSLYKFSKIVLGSTVIDKDLGIELKV